jgi:hypothetical protein
MENVIAIRAKTDQGQARYWLTWGRLFDAVDPEPMIAAVRPHLRWSDRHGEIVEITVCRSLQEASTQPYFYEGLFWLGQTHIPPGDGYEDWKRTKRDRLADGRELFYLGDPGPSPDS